MCFVSNDIGDIIRTLAPPKAALPEPAIADQVRPPTAVELKAIEELCCKAAKLQDELKAIEDTRPKELSDLKKEIKIRMLKHGLHDVSIAGRPPIELAETNSRKPTRKAIVAVHVEDAVKKLTEEQKRDPKQVKKAEADGKMRALNLWNAIETTTSHSVKIPDPAPPPDMEPNY